MFGRVPLAAAENHRRLTDAAKFAPCVQPRQFVAFLSSTPSHLAGMRLAAILIAAPRGCKLAIDFTKAIVWLLEARRIRLDLGACV
jgi:hypothetical protein